MQAAIDHENSGGKATKGWAGLASGKGAGARDVPDVVKVEYMLRYHNKKWLQSIFPYMPVGDCQALIFGLAGVRYKDELTIEKLFTHLKAQADASIALVDEDFRATLRPLSSSNQGKHEYVSLKELRDLVMGYRCSNDRLFMFGMANEGRLGVDVPGLQ